MDTSDKVQPDQYENVEDMQNLRSFNTCYDEQPDEDNINIEGEKEEKTFYKFLDLDKNSSDEEIKRKFKEKSSLYHPDRNEEKNKNKRKKQYFSKKQSTLNSVKETLTDPHKRVEYDVLGKDSKKIIPFIGESNIRSLFSNMEDYKKYLIEEKRLIRKNYMELLTESSSHQQLTIDYNDGFGGYSGPFSPIITLIDSVHRFSFPLSSQDVVRFIGFNKFMFPNRTVLNKGIQYRHYFMNKNNHNRNHVGCDFQYFQRYGLFSFQFQRMIDFKKRKFVFQINNDTIIYPKFGYLGYDIRLERKLFKKCQGYIGFHFPYHRRTFFSGISQNDDKEIRVSINNFENRITLEGNIFEIPKLKAYIRLVGEVNLFKLDLIHERKQNQLQGEKSPNHVLNGDVSLMFYKELFRKTFVGIGMGFDPMGPIIKLYFKRQKHHFTMNMRFPKLGEFFLHFTVPLCAFFVIKKVFWDFLWKKSKKKKEKEDILKNIFVETLDDRLEWEKEIQENKEKMIEKRLFEMTTENNKGLIILDSKYGVFKLMNDGEEVEEESEVVLENWINVTESLQYHVEKGKLFLDNESKSILSGFYDVFPRKKKRLYIEYQYMGKKFKVVYDDEVEVNLPLNVEYLYENQTDFTA